MADPTEITEEENSSAKGKKKKKGSFRSKLLWFLVLVVTFGLLRHTAMLLLVGMLPTLVVKFIDDSDEAIWFKTVFCFNLAGIYPYIIDIVITHNNSMKALQAQMADSMTWLAAYGAASMGYAALWFCPYATEFFMRVFTAGRLDRHRKKLVKLHKEWGVGDPTVDLN